MKRVYLYSLLIFTVLFSSGFTKSDSDLMEASLLQKNYGNVKVLAHKFLAKENLAPTDRQKIQYYLGISLLYLKDYRQAREVFNNLISSESLPDWKDKASIGIINSYYMEEDYMKALDEAKRLKEMNPNSAYLSLIHLKIARAHLKMANWTEARDHLKIIVNEYPKSMEFFTARQLLEEKKYFSVQVGSFRERDGAEKLVKQLSAKDEYGYIIETTDQRGQTLYRVRVGQLGTLKEAQRLAGKLKTKGMPSLIYP